MQHVDELRQLVQSRAAQEAAGAGDARVVAHGQRQAFRIRAHGAELVDQEGHAVPPHALLAEEHRARRVELDPQRDNHHQRRQQQQRQASAQQVKRSFAQTQASSAACTARTTRCTSSSLMRVYNGRLSMRS